MDLMFTLNSNASIDGYFKDGQNFIKSHPHIGIPYTVFLCLATFLGTTGNILIITTVLISKKLRSIENVFIVNLAIADLCVTGFVDPFSIVGVFRGEAYFVDKPILCELVASVCLTSCFCSLLSIGAISFNRYIHICHQRVYTKLYGTKSCLVMVVGLWVTSFILEVPNFVGWGDHVFDHKTRSCVWDRTADFSYTLFFALVGVCLPLIIISVCYVRIFLYVRQAKKRIAQSGDQSNNKAKKERQDSIKLARTLFIIFVVFAICWSPYAFIVVLDVKDSFAIELHAFTILLAHTNSSINCILYGLFNQNFRRGYKELLCMCTGRRFFSSSHRLTTPCSATGDSVNRVHVLTLQVPSDFATSECSLETCVSKKNKVVGREACA